MSSTAAHTTAPEDHPAVSDPHPDWLASRMAPTDRAKEALGIAVESLDRGSATVSMTVREDMVNGFGSTHGGFVFALADTAFAYACNESAAPTVASGAEITFTRPSRTGDRLTATAERRWRAGRNGLYDVTVRDQHGETVAEFRGRSFTTDRPMPTASK